jgi:putative phosphoesterase
MLLGIMADSHDNLPRLAAACRTFRERGVDAVIHAGDFVAPFALKLLVREGLPVLGVFGNNDGERAGLRAACAEVYDAPHRCQVDGRTIVIAHSPDQLAGAAGEGADLLVHGHTHQACIDDGPPLLVNPGETGGWLTGRCTVAVADLQALTAELIELDGQETVAL